MKKLILIALLALSANTFAQWATSKTVDVLWEEQVKSNILSLEKELGMAIRYDGEDHEFQDFTWHFADTGTGNGWAKIRGEWKGSNCDYAIIALFDANDKFLMKMSVGLDFGTFDRLITDVNVVRNAKSAKIKCE